MKYKSDAQRMAVHANYATGGEKKENRYLEHVDRLEEQVKTEKYKMKRKNKDISPDGLKELEGLEKKLDRYQDDEHRLYRLVRHTKNQKNKEIYEKKMDIARQNYYETLIKRNNIVRAGHSSSELESVKHQIRRRKLKVIRTSRDNTATSRKAVGYSKRLGYPIVVTYRIWSSTIKEIPHGVQITSIKKISEKEQERLEKGAVIKQDTFGDSTDIRKELNGKIEYISK